MDVRFALIDTSAWARRRDPAVRSWFERATANGSVVLSDVVVLEFLRHVPARDYRRVEQDLQWFRVLPVASSDWHAAHRIQQDLARSTAQDHRKVKIADLLIAAAAQRADLTLVHYDDDFDRIGQVTNQPMRWLAPRGTLGDGGR